MITMRMVKLGEIFKTASGGTPLRNNKDYYADGTIMWVKSGEVAQGEIFESEERITDLALKESSAKIFPFDTVVVAMYEAIFKR